MTTTKQMTMTQIAKALGNNDRISREAMLPIHQAYTKADAAQQKQMREDWTVAYIEGNLSLTTLQAAKIAAQPRTERKPAHQQAYDRARQQFKYHVVRDDKKGSNKAEPATPAQQAERFMKQFHEMDAATRRAVIRLLKSEGIV